MVYTQLKVHSHVLLGLILLITLTIVEIRVACSRCSISLYVFNCLLLGNLFLKNSSCVCVCCQCCVYDWHEMANKFRRWCGFPSIQGPIDGTQGNFLVQYNQEQKKKLALRTLHFYLVHSKLYCQDQDQVLRHYFHESEIPIVLQKMHEGVNGGHFSSDIIVCKILDVKYWWPTMHKDVFQYCQTCDNCH